METLEGKGVMRAWVEPEDHDFDKNGPRPIVQLDIETISYIAEAEVRGSTAVASQEPCKSLPSPTQSKTLTYL